jgi:hypothetical protein
VLGSLERGTSVTETRGGGGDVESIVEEQVKVKKSWEK